MATRKQSNPAAALGPLFAGPNDRTPDPMAQVKAGQTWQERQAYVDSKPGTAMYAQYGSHLERQAAQLNEQINQRLAARDDNSRRRF